MELIQKLKSTSLKNSAIPILMNRFLGNVFRLIGMLYIYSILLPSEIGKFSLFLVINGIFLIFIGFGFDGASEKIMSENNNIKRFILASYFTPLLFMLIATVFVTIFSHYINHYIGLDISFIVIISALMNHYYQNGLSLLRVKKKFFVSGLIEGFQRIFLTLSQIFVALFVGTARSLIDVFILTHILFSVINLLIVYEKPEIRIKNEFTSLIVVAPSFLIVEGINSTRSWLDVALFGFFLNKYDIGIYSAIKQIAITISMVGQAYGTVILPRVSYWKSINNFGKIERILKNSLILTLFMCITGILLLSLFSGQLLNILYGTSYSKHLYLLLILAISQLFNSIYIIMIKFFYGLGKNRIVIVISVLTVLLQILLQLVTIDTFGLLSAGIAMTIANFTGFSLTFYIYFKKRAGNYPSNY